MLKLSLRYLVEFISHITLNSNIHKRILTYMYLLIFKVHSCSYFFRDILKKNHIIFNEDHVSIFFYIKPPSYKNGLMIL